MSAKWERKEEGEAFFFFRLSISMTLLICLDLICDLHLHWGLLFLKSIGFESQTVCTLASNYDSPLAQAQPPGFSSSRASALAATCRWGPSSEGSSY